VAAVTWAVTPCRLIQVLLTFRKNILHAYSRAVSRRCPTAAARVRSELMWDLWWTKWHWGIAFLRILRFPLPILITPLYHPGLAQLRVEVPSGFSLTPPQQAKRKACCLLTRLILRSSSETSVSPRRHTVTCQKMTIFRESRKWQNERSEFGLFASFFSSVGNSGDSSIISLVGRSICTGNANLEPQNAVP
jgi:hypothetical protein